MSDWTGMREQAKKQAAAWQRMEEIGEGIGGLGARHPEMFADMQAWDSITDNDHADVILALIDTIEALEQERDSLVNSFDAHLRRVRAIGSELQR